MRHAVSIAAILLLLSACSSNQQQNISQQNHLEENPVIQKAVDKLPQRNTPSVPLDGRLRNEHLQMYVSVKIKQEQIRYEQAITYIKNTNSKKDTSSISADIDNERLAMQEFSFDPELYFWAKQVISKTLELYAKKDQGKRKRVSNFEEAVIAHNLSMIDKFKDELQFAQNYKLRPPTSAKPRTVKIEKAVAQQQMALVDKTSY